MALQRGITREDSFREAIESIPSDFKLSWGVGLNSEDFSDTEVGGIFEEIGDVGQLVASFIDSTGALLELVSASIEVALLNLGIVVDIFEGVLVAINLLLQQFRELLTGTSAHFMFHFPTSYKSRRSPSELMYDIGMSYLDKQDSKKPIANINDYAGVVVAIWSLPNLQKLRAVFDKITKSLKGISFDELSTPTFKNGFYLDEKFVEEGTSSKPDWTYGVSLTDIGVFKKASDKLKELMSLIDSKRSYTDTINAVINLVIARLQGINNTISSLEQTLESVTVLLTLGDSNGIFSCTGSGTNEDFAKALINSPMHPNYPSVEFLDNVDLNKPGNEIQVDIGRGALFSGAMAIHLQTIGPIEDRVNAIIDLFIKQKDELPLDQVPNIVRTSFDRFNQTDLSSDRLDREQ